MKKSKDAVTKYYKDPLAAQFSQLILVRQNNYPTALCGSVNGKNSYGGYVGSTRFYVSWHGTEIAQIWNEGESTASRKGKPHLEENTAKIRKVEAEIADLICKPSEINTTNPVE